MSFDVRISEYPASDVVRVAARNSLDGSLIFADQVFRPAVRHPDFGGAGLYAVFCGAELIYIGKYLGLQNDFSGGNIIDQRWTKHLGTFTMRTRNLGFSKRALAEITAHLAGCAHEIPTAIETGFRDARSEVLLQKTGCMTTFQRFLVASRIWQQTNGDVTLDDFKFVYAKIDSDLPVGVVRAIVTKAEDAALDIIHPDGNTIAKRRDTMLPRVTELIDLFKGFLTDANLSFKAWADTRGEKLETTMTPSTEPEETGAACKFLEQIVVAPEAAQRFIENVIERFDTVDDSTINYTDTPDLRVRRIVPGALGFINAATLSWQVRHQRLLLRSLLSQSDLAECGLRIDRVGGLVLAHESFLPVPLLESHGDQIIKALLKARATRESRN